MHYLKSVELPLETQRHHEESEEDEDDWTEDEDVSTPLDPIDPFVAFADTLASLQRHMPARFQARFLVAFASAHDAATLHVVDIVCGPLASLPRHMPARLKVRSAPGLWSFARVLAILPR